MQRLAKGFTNWAGTQSCLPTSWQTPGSTTEVAEIVGSAASRGGRVKVAGAGHSFSDIALTDGVMLSLDRLDELSDHDRALHRVTVGAGIRLHDLNERLHTLGLAMPNLGDIDVQSLAGATATATHGTGARLGNLSTAIVGFELVTGTGEILWCDPDQHPEVFAVGRVGLGALGVVTRIRLQCVPSFVLRAHERVTGLDATLDAWHDFITGADHAELFFIPGLGACFTKQNRRTGEPEQPTPKARYWLEKHFAENIALDLAMRAHRRWPQRRNTILRGIAAVSSDREVVDRSYRVFASPRHVQFIEMEYGIPVDAIPEAVGRVSAMVKAMERPPLFPIEVRCSAGDDIAVSTAEGRDTGWIAVHQYQGEPWGEYFGNVEAIMNEYDGRPHWGKFHYQTHDVLAERYPRWNEFAEVRAKTDPGGTFRNAYLDRVLGPIR